MPRLLPQASLLASLFLLTACSGPAEPSFPRKLDSSNSIKAVVKVEGGGHAQVELYAGYFASSDSCKYTPRAYGIVAMRGPVASTASLMLDVKELRPSEFSAQVPLPRPDKCDWRVRTVSPKIVIDGTPATVFRPHMSVTGSTYLPEGNLTYHCDKNYGSGSYVACSLTGSDKDTITINISFSK